MTTGVTQSDSPGISQRTTVYAAREMLKYAGAVVVLDKFGATRPMPQNKSTVIKFRRPNVFSAATTPLQEGVTPAATQFSYSDVSGTLRQYGQVAQTTDVVQDTHEDPVLNDMAKQCGENIGRTTEALRWGVLRAGTNVFYANGSARNAVNTPISLSKQRAVVRALLAQKAMMMTKTLDASPNYGTKPIEAAWIAVAHTDLESDIRNLPGFTPCAEYGSRKVVHERECGSVENVRYVLSPDLSSIVDAGGTFNGSGTSMVTSAGSAADIYPILYFGQDAYGIVPLRGANAVEPTIIPPNVKSKSDPLGQRGYVGWKIWELSLILNQLWMARLEVASTAL